MRNPRWEQCCETGHESFSPAHDQKTTQFFPQAIHGEETRNTGKSINRGSLRP